MTAVLWICAIVGAALLVRDHILFRREMRDFERHVDALIEDGRISRERLRVAVLSRIALEAIVDDKPRPQS